MTKTIAIIGAGLGGLTLALALHKRGLNVVVYESRQPDNHIGGAIMMSPNGLRILDKLGIYSRIASRGFVFETLNFAEDKTFQQVGSYPFGSVEEYGYAAVRIYRSILVEELTKTAQEVGIQVHYGKKFSRVISEDEGLGVKFAFDDSSDATASFLVGADGLHSKVRRYIYPNIEPLYTGMLGVTFASQRNGLRFPPGHESLHLPAAISGEKGTYAMAPQVPDGSELFTGRPLVYPSQERRAWDLLLKNQDELVALLRDGMETWSDFVQSSLEQLDTERARETLNIWAFHKVPHMESWTSETGRVVILGDAAHALPPTTGQGANQAMEDALTFAVVVEKLIKDEEGRKKTEPIPERLAKWTAYRQGRVDRLMQVKEATTGKVLSGEGTKNMPSMDWLYKEDVEETMSGRM